MEYLNKYMSKRLKKVLSGPIQFNVYGRPTNMHEALPEALNFKYIPSISTEYQPQEYVFARIPVNNPHFRYMDTVIPVLTQGGKSVQGIATFVTFIPAPIRETFVERSTLFSNFLIPLRLADSKDHAPKEVRDSMIESVAVNAINKDSGITTFLHGDHSCSVDNTGFIALGQSSYKLKINHKHYPPGMFTIVPYGGNTILIAKEAGEMGAAADKPRYYFKWRYQAMEGIARHISENPEQGNEDKGFFFLDPSLEIILPPLLKHLHILPTPHPKVDDAR